MMEDTLSWFKTPNPAPATSRSLAFYFVSYKGMLVVFYNICVHVCACRTFYIVVQWFLLSSVLFGMPFLAVTYHYLSWLFWDLGDGRLLATVIFLTFMLSRASHCCLTLVFLNMSTCRPILWMFCPNKYRRFSSSILCEVSSFVNFGLVFLYIVCGVQSHYQSTTLQTDTPMAQNEEWQWMNSNINGTYIVLK